MGFLVQYADWVLGVHGIYLTYLVHVRHSRWINLHALVSTLAWIWYGMYKGQYGYVPQCAISVAILLYAMRRQYVEDRSVRAVEVENGEVSEAPSAAGTLEEELTAVAG